MGERRILINADDLGYHETFNEAIVDILAQGIVRSASIMAPGPAFDDAVQRLGAAGITDVGVHLALGGEYARLPVRPVWHPEEVASLVNDRGCFFGDINEVRDTLDPHEVRLELEAQIDKVQQAGLTITHLDGHMFFYEADQGGPELLAIADSLADRLRVSLRCRSGARSSPVADHHMLWREQKSLAGRVAFYEAFLRAYDSPLSELIIHPGKELATMERFSSTGERRFADYRFFSAPRFKEIILERGIQVVSWPQIIGGH